MDQQKDIPYGQARESQAAHRTYTSDLSGRVSVLSEFGQADGAQKQSCSSVLRAIVV
jgi:hypothetical protein